MLFAIQYAFSTTVIAFMDMIICLTWWDSISVYSLYLCSVYLSPNYILIASLLIYFPLHMALALKGHWIIYMGVSIILCRGTSYRSYVHAYITITALHLWAAEGLLQGCNSLTRKHNINYNLTIAMKSSFVFDLVLEAIIIFSGGLYN